MCGLTGIFGITASGREAATEVQSMMDAISHRGPDGRGYVLDSCAALGHVRLAVLDVKGGSQPLKSPDGRIWLAYNGEIYNFRELRKQLIHLGCRFRTKADTEVLLAAWQEWGESSVDRLNGMFAFSIWDRQERKGCLVRDPVGIKPLFYYQKGGQLLFASEVKAILAALSRPPEFDPVSLHFLMNFRYLPGDRTMWKGIRQVPPGCMLTWNDGNVRIRTWAASLFRASDSSVEYSEEVLAQLLEDCVHRQLVSDVPIGGYLSSGIDSGLLTALAVDEKGTDRNSYPTFTIRTGDSPEEAAGAARTAWLLGVSNFQEDVSPNIHEWLPWLLWHLEVPKVNALQSAMVAGLACRHVKVALSGLGGDELFYGYNIHRFMSVVDMLQNPLLRPVANLTGRAVSRLFDFFGTAGEELKRGGEVLSSTEVARAYGILRNVWDSPEGRRRLYGPRLIEADLPSAYDILRAKWPVGCDDAVEAAARFELKEKMVNDLLWNEDRVSMAFGLEVRVPFLDLELLRAVTSVSRRKLMPRGRLKYLLRRISRRWLPAEVIRRPKSGFQLPAHQFFHKHLRVMLETCLPYDRMKQTGLFNPDFVKQVVNARPDPRLRWHYFILYLMIGMEIWLELFDTEQLTPPDTPCACKSDGNVY